MTRRVAEKVGPSGHVFSTEIDPTRIRQIHKAIEKQRLTNVTVIAGAAAETGLPAECCDAIFMRDVYHHFTQPVEMNRSIFRSLRPGGLLAVVDFPPRWYLRLWQPKGVPKNRGGHGIPQKILIEEVTNAGFHVERVVDNWSGKTYCVVFGKPLP